MQILDHMTADQKASWLEDGFLVFPGFYSHDEVDALDAITEWLWREKPSSLTVDDNVTGARSRFSDIAGPRDGNRLKLNDIYLLSETMREFILDRRLTPILAGVLQDDPVLINTLTIDLGTTQGAHVDSLFMTPHTDDALIATWTALEDVALDAGPLFYYPGSHRIDPYRFSSGLQSIVDSEFDAWNNAIHTQMQERGLERQFFLARKGDVLVWHARLVHGGSEITNTVRTRKSLVAHFFTKTDCVYHDLPIRRIGDAYWLNRSEQVAPRLGESIVLAPGPIERGQFAQSTRTVRIEIDYVTAQTSGQRSSPADTVMMHASDTLLVRGWAADLERHVPLTSVLVDVGEGAYIRARCGIGRHDLIGALGQTSYATSGFMASVPASVLRPGLNTLSLFGTIDDEDTIYASSGHTLTVDVCYDA